MAKPVSAPQMIAFRRHRPRPSHGPPITTFAPVIGGKPKITWYHHWEFGSVPQMPAKNEFKWDQWSSRKSDMAKKTPKHLLGFNEPDISSQANMSPASAADVWMQEIHPWAAKGVKLGSPAVAWNLDWTASFLSELKKRGGHVDFVTKFVSTAHSRFGYQVWVTELGVTSASKAQQQTKDFMMSAFSWMDSTGYVDRASWFGCFESSKPPDAYATAKNALLKDAGSLSDLGYWYGYSSQPDRRADDLKTRHHAIAARLADPDAQAEAEAADDGVPPNHCDEICELRNAALEGYDYDEEA
ncbi:glycosyl hydrolase catalytic core-domain-containing protein [Mycena alexandri]|uniref:Glycosyl hydrolase catalytic core-domain-containing protein n=1 Tax=Mycena alexandri TaxID=1745969 RepID=A0AAD6S0J7_9AGAR|nr:glycosyl hydrolase catalytic core-domain-containing protein [Mycena alexandri]